MISFFLGKRTSASFLSTFCRSSPSGNDKYLLRGQIWLDASTYRICRIEGVPAKSPSIWLKRIHITLQFAQTERYVDTHFFRRHRYSPLLRAVHTCWPQYPITRRAICLVDDEHRRESFGQASTALSLECAKLNSLSLGKMASCQTQAFPKRRPASTP